MIYEVAWKKQVYYCKYKCKTHKHYNYLQSIFNQKLITKDIKIAKQQGLGFVDQVSTNKGDGAQRSESKLRCAN